jgi:hypothetical protein
MRDFQFAAAPPECVTINGAEVRAGSTVRLHPRGQEAEA